MTKAIQVQNWNWMVQMRCPPGRVQFEAVIPVQKKEVNSSRGKSPVVGKASKIYYVIGTPITQPKCNPSDEHVRWLKDTFDLEEVGQKSDKFDIFQAVLDQCDIPNLCVSELRDFMIDFIMKQ